MIKKLQAPELNTALRNPVWDKFIAPGISNIRKKRIKSHPRELRPDPLQFAVTAYLLGIDERTRARVFNFVRRARAAYDSYRAARSAYTRIFRDQDFNSYLMALGHFETCLAAAYQAHEVLFGLRGFEFKNKDLPGRAQLNWRMDRLYNKSKHIEGMIRAQSFQGDNIAVWISNEGLRTRDETVSFDELHDIVFDVILTGSILAKSHLWRKEVPPLLEKYSGEIAKIKARSGSSAGHVHQARKKQKKPRGFPRGFCLNAERHSQSKSLKRKFRPWQAWRRPTLPSLET